MSSKLLSLIFRNALLLLVLLTFSACATVKKPLTGIVPGREVETLQSPISISVTSGEHSTSGRGYMIFKQPERFHMALLSPFGLTVFEVFIDKDRLTCLVPSKQIAYAGLFRELPDESALQSLSMIKWVVERPPIATPSPGTGEITGPSGDKFYFDDRGLLVRKLSPEGDEVKYEGYSNVNGVAFPETIIITSRYGAKVKIGFDEPEINQPVEEGALTPNLEGFSIQPLADFKGF